MYVSSRRALFTLYTSLLLGIPLALKYLQSHMPVSEDWTLSSAGRASASHQNESDWQC